MLIGLVASMLDRSRVNVFTYKASGVHNVEDNGENNAGAVNSQRDPP